MTTPYGSFSTNPSGSTPTSFSQQLSALASTTTPARGGGAKRGRKPKNANANNPSTPTSSTTTTGGQFLTSTFSASSPTASAASPISTGGGTGAGTGTFNANAASAQYPRVHWAMPTTAGGDGSASSSSTAIPGMSSLQGGLDGGGTGGGSTPRRGGTPMSLDVGMVGRSTPVPMDGASTSVLNLGITQTTTGAGAGGRGYGGGEEDVEGDDELLPAMADDDYSAQLSFQSQSKDNLKVLMDNFSPAQYDRFEAYRRHALPKQAVRKVIQQACGQQVSQPVAQIIAGFSKVFVGEMVEKARAVQQRRGETGPLTPDHLREAYRAYQEETGHVGAARPLKSKRLFTR